MKISIAAKILIATLGIAWISQAQEPPQVPDTLSSMERVEHGSEVDPLSLPYKLKGESIPQYFLVKHFLLGAYHDPSPESRPSYLQLLKDLGIEEGSRAEVAFQHAVEEVQELVYGPNGPIVEEKKIDEGDLNGAGATTSVLRHGGGGMPRKQSFPTPEEMAATQAQEARDLADIYCDLLDEISEDGAEVIRVNEYIYRTVAPSATLASDEPLDERRPYLSAFDARLMERGYGPQQIQSEVIQPKGDAKHEH